MAKEYEILIKANNQASEKFREVAKDAANTAQEVQSKTGGSWLSNLAKGAKALRREQRTSGEGALMRILSSPNGLATAGLQSLGIGIPAMIADQIGKGLADASDHVADFMFNLSRGAKQ